MATKNIRYKVDTIELQKAAVERGLTKIKALAIASGIDRNTLGKVMSGKITPSATVMYALANTLELTEEQAGIIFFNRNLRIA